MPSHDPAEQTPDAARGSRPPRTGRVRKAVFGTLWLLVGIAVAAALVKLAFFNEHAGNTAEPTGQLTSPTVTVSRSTVVNTFTVSGQVSADAGVPVRATDQGTVTVLFHQQGDTVNKGERLFEVREEVGQTQPEPISGPSNPSDPNATEVPPQFTQPEPIYAYHTITAPASGVLQEFTPLPKMGVSIGQEVGTIGPGTFTVTASLTASLQYRMLDQPSEATVSITGGPAPFACSSLQVGAAPNGVQQQPEQPAQPQFDPSTGMMVQPDTSATTGQIRCAVPPDQKVFAGLTADVEVVSGEAEDVLTVPTTAVRGDFATGVVYRVDPADGQPHEVQVQLGLTDGESIEIKDGLAEGDSILEYVPSEVPTGQPGLANGPVYG